jgi:predicted GNAT family acetyltransferase
MEISVYHQREKGRFLANVKGREAFMKYAKPESEILEIVSTFIPAELRGQGIACQIAAFACNYALAKQLKIKASCPYLAQYIENNPAVFDAVTRVE